MVYLDINPIFNTYGDDGFGENIEEITDFDYSFTGLS